METDIVIIGMTDILDLYHLTRKQATRLLNTKGCPLLPRRTGEPYRVIQDEFEMWLRSRRNG